MKILITGGTGYIGSHIATLLLEAGNDVILLDNLTNSKKNVVSDIEFICESYPDGNIDFYRGDLMFKRDIELVFDENEIDAVIHLANKTGFIDSLCPTDVFENDIIGNTNLLSVMVSHNVKKLIYISSFFQTEKANFTKAIIEKMLKQVFNLVPDMSIAVLKCPEVGGTHPSTVLGYNRYNQYDCVLTSLIEQIIIEKNVELSESDLVQRRPLIHVLDIASIAINLLSYIKINSGVKYFDVNCEQKYSTKEIIEVLESICNEKIKLNITQKSVYSNEFNGCEPNDELYERIDFNAKYLLEDICSTTYRWFLRCGGTK